MKKLQIVLEVEIDEEAIKENKIEAVSRPDIDITQIGKGKK